MTGFLNQLPLPSEVFDPGRHVTFRGKPIDALTREELIEALRQALIEVNRVKQYQS